MQKLAIRYLFGDNEKFYDKFNTAARTRPLNEQRLGHDYFCREPTKPLLNEKKFLTVHNLYKYMAVNEIGKVLTTKKPSVIYDSFHLSDRNNKNLIILKSNSQKRSNGHTANTHWNAFIKKINIPNPHNIVVPMLKHKLKRFLLQMQLEGDRNNWETCNI